MADLIHQAAAYRANAHDNPHLYAVMFGGTSVPEYRSSPDDVAHGFWSFLMLVDAVQRCIDAGRFDEGDAFAVASQLWSAAHGVVTLEQQGFLDDGDDVLATMCTTLAIGLGDAPAAAHTSARRAARRRHLTPSRILSKESTSDLTADPGSESAGSVDLGAGGARSPS